MRVSSGFALGVCGLLGVSVVLSGSVLSCSPAGTQGARARVITTKRDLIGGPHALGDLGDYLLENNDARFILQQPGFSRGFGVFGGGLIDADIVRPTAGPGGENATGRDNFAEAFPAFFLVAMAPQDIQVGDQLLPAMEVLPPGGDGSAAVAVRGYPGNFLAITDSINKALVSPEFLLFETIYRLPARGRTLEITTRILNNGNDPAPFKGRMFTGSIKVDVPFGDVLLFGAGNQVFAPGDGGFDLRYRLAKRYGENVQLPALPGVVVDYMASRGQDVSYGFFVPIEQEVAGVQSRNFVMDHAAAYPGRAKPGRILVPFVASAFTGVFHTQGPAFLQPGQWFEYTRYFSVGDGDIASVAEEAYRVRKEAHGTVAGRVLDPATQQPVVGLSVVAIDEAGQPFCQATTRAGGLYSMPLPPGRYRVLVSGPARDPTTPVAVDIRAGVTEGVDLTAQPTGRIAVTVSDESGAPVPAKVTLVSSYRAEDSGRDPKEHLFNLAIGESWRNTDLQDDVLTDANTRRFVENVFHTSTGALAENVRPGSYEVHVSRGPEYDVHMQKVVIAPGGSAQVAATVRRVVDTRGYVSADFHIHSVNSIDSSILPEPRVTTYAAEGVEVMVSTDHNFVTDFKPVIQALNLNPWMNAFIGLELTTLEMGHFNGYPLRYSPAEASHGSFEWSTKTPDEIFTALRGLGALGPDRTLVQVNHPRDTILGYFNQFVWDQTDARAYGQSDPLFGVNPDNYPNFRADNFSLNFDVLEVLNGKRYEYFHTYVVPDPLPPPPLPMTIPPAGQPVLDDEGRIAFPGVIEDWYQILRLGKRLAGVSNSDSHGGQAEEAGYPRTYLRVPHDEPARLTAEELVDAVRSMNMVMTNGPFIELKVSGTDMGGLAKPENGELRVKGTVRTAPWIRPSELVIHLGGLKARTLAIPDDARNFAFDELIPVGALDTFVTVEVHGGNNMFPVVSTFDEPPLLISDAIGAIGGSLGFGGNPYGNLRPAVTFAITPFALTNPVFVDVDGNGAFDAPGILNRRPYTPPLGGVDIPAPGIGQVQGPPNLFDVIHKPVPGQATDIRRIFQALGHHHGGH